MMGKLNIFQKAMLLWNGMHPYNAVHVVRIPGPLDLHKLNNAIDRTLEILVLTGLTLDQKRALYRYNGGPSRSDIRIIECPENPQASLATEVGRQLNTPFALGEQVNPFRFFVVPETNRFSLGLAYFHAIADAESIVLLMKDIVCAYRAKTSMPSPAPATIHPKRFDNLLRHNPGVLLRKLSTLPSLVKNLRTSCRPYYRDTHDMENGVALFSLPPEHLRRLVHFGRSCGVTLNDLFLAILLKSIATLAPGRLLEAKRRRISVGCIVNARRDLGLEGRRIFGLFLGSFVVTHEVPDGISLGELAKAVHSQTLKIKRHKLYLASSLELTLGRFVLSLSSTERSRKLYQRNYPLWGGITNMNLNSLWAQQENEEPIDYFRAVSTGPATPLVLSVSTFGNGVNIGISFRSTVFTMSDIEQMKNHFMDEFHKLEAA